MKLTLISLILCVLVFSLTLRRAYAQTPLFCPSWQALYSGTLIDLSPLNSTGHTLTADQLAVLERWQLGDSFWVNSGNYGYWALPADAQIRYEIKLDTATGVHYVLIAVSPTVTWNVWVWTYDDLIPRADAQGQHAGVHHWCIDHGRAVEFILPADQFSPLLDTRTP